MNIRVVVLFLISIDFRFFQKTLLYGNLVQILIMSPFFCCIELNVPMVFMLSIVLPKPELLISLKKSF